MFGPGSLTGMWVQELHGWRISSHLRKTWLIDDCCLVLEGRTRISIGFKLWLIVLFLLKQILQTLCIVSNSHSLILISMTGARSVIDLQ